MRTTKLTLEERRAAKLESSRLRHLRIKGDPVAYARLLDAKGEDRARASELREIAKRMPQPVDAALYRRHGPFAALFALQAGA